MRVLQQATLCPARFGILLFSSTKNHRLLSQHNSQCNSQRCSAGKRTQESRAGAAQGFTKWPGVEAGSRCQCSQFGLCWGISAMPAWLPRPGQARLEQGDAQRRNPCHGASSLRNTIFCKKATSGHEVVQPRRKNQRFQQGWSETMP